MSVTTDASVSSSPVARWLVAGEVTAASLLAARLWSFAMITPAFDWNSARLFPAFLLAAGRSPYFPAMTGPATGWIYGPIMPLLMMPATLAPTITSAMVVAAAINLAVFLLPIALLLDDAARQCGLAGRRLAIGVIGLGLLPVVPRLEYYLCYIQSDQVAIALSLLASWLLIRHLSSGSTAALGAAATLAVLSVWTKQIAVAVPIAHVLYLAARRRDPKATWRYLQWFALTGAGVSLLMIAIFGFDPLVYNLWVVPAGNHLKAAATAWKANPLELLLEIAPSLIVAAVSWRVARRRAAGVFNRRPALRALIELLLILAACQLPFGLLGAAKIGGGTNSFHLAVTLYTAAALCAVAAAGTWQERIPRRDFSLVAVAAAALCMAASSVAFPLRMTPDPSLEAARVLAAPRRGQIYFPGNPLVTWWTERKVYHLEYSLIDQAVAGYPVTKERYWAYLPPDLRFWVIRSEMEPGLATQLLKPHARLESGGYVIFLVSKP